MLLSTWCGRVELGWEADTVTPVESQQLEFHPGRSHPTGVGWQPAFVNKMFWNRVPRVHLQIAYGVWSRCQSRGPQQGVCGPRASNTHPVALCTKGLPTVTLQETERKALRDAPLGL